MKQATCLLLTFMLLIGCNKEKLEPLPSVEVYDYVTGQPIQGAEINRSTQSSWSFTCLCYQVNNVSSLGFTGADGKLNGLLSLESIAVNKDKYIPASKNNHCLSEISDTKAVFHLFRVGLFEINATTNQNYTSTVRMNIYPVLKNGNLPKPYYPSDHWLGARGSFKPLGYAGITNRILVLKPSGTSIPDTLYKADVFLPENTIKQVTIIY